jgi:hypothetical protein
MERKRIMPEYEFWYDETCTYKAYFTADDNAHARGILQMVENGTISPEDIDGVQLKDKGYEIGVDTNSLSRLDGEGV